MARVKSLFLLIALGVIWGSGYAIAKYAITHGVPALGYSFWQSVGPAIFLLLVVLVLRIKVPLTKGCIVYYVVCGLLGIAVPNTIMYMSSGHLPAGILAVLANTVPIITYPLALLFMQERFSLVRALGVLLGVAGIMLIVIPSVEFSGNISLPWILLILLTPLSFAVCTIFVSAKRPKNTHVLALSCGMLISSAVMLLPIVFSMHDFYSLLPPYNLPKFLVLLEIVLSSIGYILFFILIKKAGPVFYSLVGCIVSLVGLFWGKVIFGESLNSFSITAVVLILLALFAVTLRWQKT